MSIKQSNIDKAAETLREFNIATPKVTKEDEIAYANREPDWSVDEAMEEFNELFDGLNAA